MDIVMLWNQSVMNSDKGHSRIAISKIAKYKSAGVDFHIFVMILENYLIGWFLRGIHFKWEKKELKGHTEETYDVKW